MVTAWLNGGPRDNTVVKLKDPAALALMLIDRKPRNGNVYSIHRYDRTGETYAGHKVFTYYGGDEQ